MKRLSVWFLPAVIAMTFAIPTAIAGKTPKEKRAVPQAPAPEKLKQLEAMVDSLTAQAKAQKEEIAVLDGKIEQTISRHQEENNAIEEKLISAEGKVDGLNESYLTTKSDVDKLTKLSVSGYIQARDEWQWMSRTGTSAITPVEPWYTGTAVPSKQNNSDNFYIRRGRVKFTYAANPTSKYVLYFDASKDKVSLKEAYVVLTEPWTKRGLSLLTGQANYPFGFEIERSSSVREVPERSKAENVLFPGERDRGLILTIPLLDKSGFRVTADGSALNGTGIGDKIFTWQDPTRRKDYTARAKVQLPTYGPVHFDFGGSGYFGDSYIPATSAAYQITGFTDTNSNKRYDIGEPLTYRYVAPSPALTATKQRLGFDGQLYYSLPLPLCKSGALFVEGYKAKDYNSKYAMTYGVVRDTLERGKDISFGVVNELGFYAMWVTNITNSTQFAARYDYWDPVRDADTLALSDKSRVKTYTAALNYAWDANVRLTAALAVPFFTHKRLLSPPFSSDYHDNYDNRSHVVTLQVQYKF